MVRHGVTLVSMAFDLKSLEPYAPKRRSFDFYKNEGINLLKCGLPLVIFTHFKLSKWLEETIDREGNKDLTTIIVVNPFTLVERYEDIIYNLSKIPNIFETDKPHTPLYTAITWSKFSFLEYAIEKNIYSTTHFCWVDFGLSYVNQFPMKRSLKSITETMWAKPEYINKIHINIPLVVDWNWMHKDISSFWTEFNSGVAAGIFGGTSVALLSLISDFWNLAEQKLDEGYAPLEQNMMAYLLYIDCDRFMPWFGQYVDLGISWGKISRYTDYLLFILASTREYWKKNLKQTKNYKDPNIRLCELLARQLIDHVLECWKNNVHVPLTTDDLVGFLLVIFECHWYRYDENSSFSEERDKWRNSAIAIGIELIEWYTNHPHRRNSILKRKEEISGNLALVGMTLPTNMST